MSRETIENELEENFEIKRGYRVEDKYLFSPLDEISDYIEKRERQAVEQTLKYVKEKLNICLVDIIHSLLDSLITTEANKE